MNDLNRTMTQNTDKISQVRKIDNEIGAILSDITEYILKENYTKATQASAYLFFAIAKHTAAKPFTILRTVYKSS